MIKFYRNTHLNNDPLVFTDDEDRYWRNRGGYIGHHLNHEEGMSLEDIYLKKVRYNELWNDSEPVDVEEMMVILGEIIQKGMARVEVGPW